MIGIMGSDDHARAVAHKLTERGVQSCLFDSRDAWEIRGDTLRGFDFYPHCDSPKPVELKSLYWRSHDGVSLHGAPAEAPSDIQDTEAISRASLFNSWLKFLWCDSCHMVNSYDAWSMHKTKPYQHYLIDQEISRFLEEDHSDLHVEPMQYGIEGCVGKSICKPAGGGDYAYLAPKHPQHRHYGTQKYLKGDTFRLYAFRNADAVAYHVQSECLDYRLDPCCLVSRCSIPLSLKDVRQIVFSGLGWNWAGIDLIINDDGVVILDVNPSPMFLGFQQSANGNQDVLNSLAEELLSEA